MTKAEIEARVDEFERYTSPCITCGALLTAHNYGNKDHFFAISIEERKAQELRCLNRKGVAS